MAKTRQKPHYKGSFHREAGKYKDTVTMDQLTVKDNFGTLGYGVFRYGIIICKVAEDYWTFVPLRTLPSSEAKIVSASSALLHFNQGRC